MKPCIDWETVHQDWLASGLSKNRYFLSGRILRGCWRAVGPTICTAPTER